MYTLPTARLEELDLRMLVDKQHVETGAARFTVYCALSFDDLTASCVHPQVDGMRVNPSF